MMNGRTYYWVYGTNHNDKPIIVGPYEGETKANDVAEKLQDSHVFPLNTKNQGQATRIVKARLAEFRGDFTSPVRNFSHAPIDSQDSELVQDLNREQGNLILEGRE